MTGVGPSPPLSLLLQCPIRLARPDLVWPARAQRPRAAAPGKCAAQVAALFTPARRGGGGGLSARLPGPAGAPPSSPSARPPCPPAAGSPSQLPAPPAEGRLKATAGAGGRLASLSFFSSRRLLSWWRGRRPAPLTDWRRRIWALPTGRAGETRRLWGFQLQSSFGAFAVPFARLVNARLRRVHWRMGSVSSRLSRRLGTDIRPKS